MGSLDWANVYLQGSLQGLKVDSAQKLTRIAKKAVSHHTLPHADRVLRLSMHPPPSNHFHRRQKGYAIQLRYHFSKQSSLFLPICSGYVGHRARREH